MIGCYVFTYCAHYYSKKINNNRLNFTDKSTIENKLGYTCRHLIVSDMINYVFYRFVVNNI